MTTLDEDIARIAALRGKPVEHYTAAEARRREARRMINPLTLGRIGTPSSDARLDLAAYDRLPERSRRFIISCAAPINALVWRDLLADLDGDEDALIDAVRAAIPERLFQ